MNASNLPAALAIANNVGAFKVPDPGASGTINYFGKGVFVCEVTTATAESRTLPTAADADVGNVGVVILQSDSGDLTVSGSSDGDVVMDNAGEMAIFLVTDADGTHQWRTVSQQAGLDAVEADILTNAGDITTNAAGISTNAGDIDALEALAYRAFAEPLSPYEFRVHDALGTLLSVGAGSSDDLGITVGVIGTSAASLNATVDDASATQEGVILYRVPEDYVDGGDLTLSVDFTRTAAADMTATLDAEVYREAAPSTDICGTASGSGDINSAASGTITFTITGTNVAAGELLNIRLAAAIDDSGGATDPAVWEFVPSVLFTVADQS